MKILLLLATIAAIAFWFFCCRNEEPLPEKAPAEPVVEQPYRPPAYQKKLEESIKQKIQPKALQGMTVSN